MTKHNWLSELNIVDFLLYVGGFIFFVGFNAFITQNWSMLNPWIWLSIVGGLTLLAGILGLVFHRMGNRSTLASVSFFVFGGSVSWSLFALSQAFGLGKITLVARTVFYYDSSGVMLSILGIALVVNMLGNFWLRYKVFGLWIGWFSTLFLISAVPFIVENCWWAEGRRDPVFLSLGLLFVVLGCGIQLLNNRFLATVFYAVGSIASWYVILSNMSLRYSDRHMAWDAVSICAICAMLVFGFVLDNNIFFVLGLSFLIPVLYVLVQTYIGGSFVWPLTLAGSGILIMALGFFIIRLKRFFAR